MRVPDIGDALQALQTESDENLDRKALTLSEALELAHRLEPFK